MNDQVIRCPNCGGAVHFQIGDASAVCPYCDSEVRIGRTVPAAAPGPAAGTEQARPEEPPRPVLPQSRLTRAEERYKEALQKRNDFISKAQMSSDPQLKKLAKRASNDRESKELLIALALIVLGVLTCFVTYGIPVLIGVIWIAAAWKRCNRNHDALARYSEDFRRLQVELDEAEAEKKDAEKEVKK